ncbi:alpha/beta hydrolase family protein [Nocardia crassostreae]|uniref:alpha/beta hydrolase family protein n=1 Tax=Nocardia crassostreae TaxID=53428 RepID=UPI000B32BB49|nr:alpha/beta fold hydrolase [Nocardia crassostreae]
MNKGAVLIPSAEVTTEIVRAGDGETFEARVYRRTDAPAAPVLICMPAMATRAAVYTPLAEALSQAGFQVVLGELRGQGTSSVRIERGVRYGYHDIVTRDYPALFAMVDAAFPEAPRYLLGHSLGGQLGALCLGQHPEAATGAILIGAPSCHHSGWPFPKNLAILAASQLAAAVSPLVGYFPGRRLGILGNDSTHLLRDFATQIRTGRYRVPSSPIDFESALSRPTLPVLAISITGDAMATPAGVRALADKLTSASVTRWTLTLDAPANPHYAWIRDNSALITRIDSFVSGSTQRIG